MKNTEKTMDKIVALCKNRGFVYPGSEIYGGLANSWDYGPLGVEFKNNVKRAWWKKFVQESKYNVGLDAAILMNREVWVASGHVGGFNDPLMDCKACKARFRADKLIEDYLHQSKKILAVFLLIDIRHAPSENDRIMYDWILERGYKPIIIATKLDKIKRSQVQKQLKLIRQGLQVVPGTKIIPFSAQTKQGREEIWELIDELTGMAEQEKTSEA